MLAAAFLLFRDESIMKDLKPPTGRPRAAALSVCDYAEHVSVPWSRDISYSSQTPRLPLIKHHVYCGRMGDTNVPFKGRAGPSQWF